MLTKSKIRSLLEARKPAGFVRTLHHLLGLADAQGMRYRDPYGRPLIKNPQIRPEECSIQALAETILGDDLQRVFGEASLSRFNRYMSACEGSPLLEASGVDVTQFLNINTFNASVGGLVEFKVLEGWSMPGYDISEQIFPSVPTRLNGQRMGRIGSMADAAARRRPSEPTKRVGLEEEWIDTPETEEFALSMEVNQETVFFDLTNDALSKAAGIGEAVKWRKEYRCIDVLIGETNSYEYKDTAYNTYLSTDPPASGQWLNDQVNPLTDADDLSDALLLFSRMTDPVSGKRVVVAGPHSIVTVPSLEKKVAEILQATATQQNTQISGGVAQEMRHTLNWISGKINTVITSPLLHEALTDTAKTTGGNLSEANSKRWWLIARGAFAYMENWPLRVDQANPNSKEMLDRGVLAFYKASERGVPIPQEPRKVIRNKVA